MKNYQLKAVLIVLLLVTSFLPCSQIASGQEISGGVKLVDTSPFLFAEAKFWVLAVEVGAGLSSTDTANSGEEPSPVDFSLGGKLYPIKVMNFSPYLGFGTHYSSLGPYKSRFFGGVEFDFPGENIPLSVFGGGDYVTSLAAGLDSFGWHLGVKYTFSL